MRLYRWLDAKRYQSADWLAAKLNIEPEPNPYRKEHDNAEDR